MTSAASSAPATPDERVTCSDRSIVVRDERIFGPAGESLCARFLERAFAVDGVRSIALDRLRSTVTINHNAGRNGVIELLRKLSAAFRDNGPSCTTPALPRVKVGESWTIYRHGAILSACEVLRDRPGRLRVRHDAFHADPALAARVERLIATVPGVHRAILSMWTKSLLICYDPLVLGTARLVRLTEEALDDSGFWEHALTGPSRRHFGLANSNVGLAALADFAFPALMPVSAALLIGTNLPVFKAAGLQVRNRQLGLPVLYTAIAVATLASGQFFASALMFWCFKFWNGRLNCELSAERRRLLAECLPMPRLARLITPDGGEVLVPIDRLVLGDRLVVETDEPVPADGRVIEGEGIVDERGVRGLDGASRKRPGDIVLAGSVVLAGALRMEVAIPNDRTRASAIGRALIAASSAAPGPPHQAFHAESFASRTVGPTLATAGLGLLIGDLTAVSAILRPDYATGPGVALPLESLRNAVFCARRGIVVRTADAFDRLAAADLIVIDDSVALRRCALEVAELRTDLSEVELLRVAASAFRHLADERASALAAACRARRIHLLDLPPAGFGPGVTVTHGKRLIRVREYAPAPSGSGPLIVEIDGTPAGLISFGRSSRLEAAAALQRLRDLAPVPVVLVSNRPAAEVASLAVELGAETHLSSLAPDDAARFLDNCRQRGLRTAFVGDCRRQGRAAANASVAVSLVGDADLDSDPAAIMLLQPRLDLFTDVWEVARSHAGRVRSAQQFILVPNLLCVAGAFLFGATALSSVVLTNLGTLGLYSRAVTSLRALDPPGRTKARLPRVSQTH